MKSKLYWKLFGSYLIFAAAGFLVIFLFSSSAARNFMVQNEAYRLYNEANKITTNYIAEYYSGRTTLRELSKELDTISSYLEGNVQLIGTDGTILLDSDTEFIELPDERPKIEAFDPALGGSRYYTVDTFFNTFDGKMINVLSPITVNYKVRGYIAIHEPLSAAYYHADQLINIIYVTFGILLVVALAVLILVGFWFVRPVRRISKIAMEYANHDFTRKVQTGGSDEVGKLAASVNSMGNELNTLEDDQRKFVSNISHDFRSPLTSIKGYVNAILDGTIPPDMQEKYLNIVVFEADRLNKLTQNLLELNKFGGKQLLDLTDFDINQVIKTTAMSFEGIGIRKNLSIDLILTGETMYVHADEGKIQQVLYNLIDNAMKFSHPNSVLTIETTQRNDKVYVSVRDSGIGIPKDSLHKVWDRFYKIDQSRGKDKTGTGLGLAIVKEIIQSHGEEINVISTEHVGTEFTFTLKQS